MMDKVTLRCSALGLPEEYYMEDGPTNGRGILATYAYHLRQEVGNEAIDGQANWRQ